MNEKILELLEEFRKKVDKVFIGQTPKLPDGMDEVYNCDIYIYRHPGMGNSKQIIVGDKTSVMTATVSYLETLLAHNMVTETELKDMVEMAINASNGEFEGGEDGRES